MKEIVFYARGGQGAVTAAAVLVTALSKEGKYAQAFPFFGGERRGAPVKAFLRIDDKPITTRSQIYKPDCIVVLDSKLPGTMNVFDGLKQPRLVIKQQQHGVGWIEQRRTAPRRQHTRSRCT